MKKPLLLCLFLLLTLPAYCQMDHTTLVELFFTEYTLLGPDKALEHLYATAPAPQRNRSAFEQQLAELRKLSPENVGPLGSYHHLVTRSASPYLVSSSYLVRYGQQPVRFTFTFYQATDRWGLYAFAIDRNLVRELNETLRLDYPDQTPSRQP